MKGAETNSNTFKFKYDRRHRIMPTQYDTTTCLALVSAHRISNIFLTALYPIDKDTTSSPCKDCHHMLSNTVFCVCIDPFSVIFQRHALTSRMKQWGVAASHGGTIGEGTVVDMVRKHANWHCFGKNTVHLLLVVFRLGLYGFRYSKPRTYVLRTLNGNNKTGCPVCWKHFILLIGQYRPHSGL